MIDDGFAWTLSASTCRVAMRVRAVSAVRAGKTVVAPRGARTFGEFTIEYLSGELSLRFPDHVRSRDPGLVEDDKARLTLYVLPRLRDFPLSR